MSNKEGPDGQPFLSKGSQECFETECEPCGENGNLVKAEGYCVTCKEFMCPNCIISHKSMKMSRRHKIQGPDEMPKTKFSDEEDNVALATQDEPTSLCKSHKKEIIKYFCKDHKTVCCVDCVTLSHRSCANIHLVNEVCNDDATSTELKHFFQRLNGVADGFRNLLEMAENNRMKIEEQRGKLLQEIRIYKESIIEAINKVVHVIETTVEKKIKEDQVKTEELSKCCNTIQKNIDVMSTEFESLQNSNQKSEEFILMNQSEKQLDEWEGNKQEMVTNTDLNHVDFCPSLKLRRTFKEIKEIGLLVEETDADQCEACKTMTLKTNMQSLSCGHSSCDVCIPDATENKRTCPVCDSVTVKCKRCQATVDQYSISSLACGHEVCLSCRKQQTESEAPCTDCGLITGNQPDGSFRAEEDYLCLDIKVTFPHGKQKSYHPRPGEAYNGHTLICELDNNERGKEICQMLRTAFDRKLVCRIDQDKVTPNIELYTGSIIGLGLGTIEEYRAYISRVTERLKKLGITK